jgi:hypothetical protein
VHVILAELWSHSRGYDFCDVLILKSVLCYVKFCPTKKLFLKLKIANFVCFWELKKNLFVFEIREKFGRKNKRIDALCLNQTFL